MTITKKALLLSTALTTTISLAQSLEFKDVKLSGSGCKPGTTTNVLSPDGTTLSILFDELFVEVPQFSGDNDNDEFSDDNEESTSKFDKNVDRKVCLMNIETNVPKNHKIESIELSYDYRGSTYTEKGTLTSFKTKVVNFQGPSGRYQYPEKLLATKRFRQDTDQDFTLSQSRTLPIESECKSRKSTSKFALKNIIVAKTMERFAHLEPSAFIALDSADLQAKVKVKVKLKRCNNSGGDHSGGFGRDNSRTNYQRQRCLRLGGRWDHRLEVCHGMRGRGSRSTRVRR